MLDTFASVSNLFLWRYEEVKTVIIWYLLIFHLAEDPKDSTKQSSKLYDKKIWLINSSSHIAHGTDVLGSLSIDSDVGAMNLPYLSLSRIVPENRKQPEKRTHLHVHYSWNDFKGHSTGSNASCLRWLWLKLLVT